MQILTLNSPEPSEPTLDSSDPVLQSPDSLPRVTKLTQGLRDANRVNVFLDGKFTFSLDFAQVAEFGLKVGQTLTSERLAELRTASEFGKLYQRTLEWVLSRPHSIRETTDYLRRRQLKRSQTNRLRARDGKKPLPELDDQLIALVLARLEERSYLNDQRFAEYFVENRMTRRGISQRRLRVELRQKGIDDNVITDVLLAKRDDVAEMQKIIVKKRHRYNDDQLVAYLVRQGFNYQDAKEAVAESIVEDSVADSASQNAN